MQCLVHIPGCHKTIDQISERCNSQIQQIRQEGTDHAESQEKYQSHDADEAGNSSIFTGKYFINRNASKMFFTLFWLDDGLIANFLDKIKSHVSDGGGPVQSPFIFHLYNNMFQHFFFVLIQMKAVENQGITFCQFGSGKTNRDTCFCSMIFNQMHNGMETTVNSTPIVIGVTVINFGWFLLIFCHVKSMRDQFINPFVFGSGDRDDRNTKHLFHLIDMDGASVFPDFIHHVQCKNHRNIQFHELHGQIQVPLNIGGIHNIDNSFWMLVQHKVSGDDLFTGIR